MAWVKLDNFDSIPDGLTAFRKQRRNIAVLKQDNSIKKVFEDDCPHNSRIKISSDYILKEETITCRYHGACWKLQDGETVKGPGGDGLRLFDYKIDENNNLTVLLE